MSQTKLSNSLWPGKIKLFQDRESSGSDIPAGDREIVKLFYSVRLVYRVQEPGVQRVLCTGEDVARLDGSQAGDSSSLLYFKNFFLKVIQF